MSIDHKHVILGQLYEQSWLLNQQFAALQAELAAEKARAEVFRQAATPLPEDDAYDEDAIDGRA